jgi:hypothetical protein
MLKEPERVDGMHGVAVAVAVAVVAVAAVTVPRRASVTTFILGNKCREE